MIRKLHFWVGAIGIVIFILSGQYFQHAMNSLQDVPDLPRVLLRTSHVYFFFTCLVNVIMGMYYPETGKERWYQWANQLLLVVAPFLVMYGFLFESTGNTGIERPVGINGPILMFVWLSNVGIGRLIVKVRGEK